MLTCYTCNEEVQKYANGKKCRICYNKYMSEYILDRYHRRRAEAIKQLGGKCVDCGSTERLEFDHIDPKTKTGDTGKLFTRGEDRLQAELAKCQLLCTKCHINKTTVMLSVEHGGGVSGKGRCKCAACKEKKNEYMRIWKRNKRLIIK